MFTDEEKKLLEKYVTSSSEDIFAVRGMEGMVGAAYARYSRAQGGFREVLLKEFIKEGMVDPRHADELIERILIAYGDDSVGELEGAHVSFENISMIATKEIEDRRIGGSPIEQSTRYVFYDQKNDSGQWRYWRGKEMVNSEFGAEYTATMDFIFGTYASLVEPMKEFFQKRKPMEDAEYDINGDGKKEKLSELTDPKDIKAFRITYGFDLRSKACDTLRSLLPLATLTNVGIFGNGRFFQNVIGHLLTSDLPEGQLLAEKTAQATGQIIPQYVRRARRSDYLVEVRKNMQVLANELLGNEQPPKYGQLPHIELMPKIDEDVSIVSAMLYPYSVLPLDQIRKKISSLDQNAKNRIIETYIGDRKTRRDRPGRALEDGYTHTFDLITNWGVYKDLMRHRMNTQQRQAFSTKIGFYLAPELEEAGFAEKAMSCAKKADELYDRIARSAPLLAQYAVLHGHYIRWSLGMNDREAMHLLELRTTPQGHPNYRQASQIMHRLIAERYPWRAKAMKFVEHGDYYWSRADSEAKQRVKERKWEEKFGKTID